MNKLEQAARDFCAADVRLQQFRLMWRKLKQEHNGEDVDGRCLVAGSKDPSQWCEACLEYPLADYRDALRCKDLAKRRMRNWYVAILKKENTNA